MDDRSNLREIAKLLETPSKLPRLKSPPDLQDILSKKHPGKWIHQEKIKKAQIRKLLMREATAASNRLLLSRPPPKLSPLSIPTSSIPIESLLKDMANQRAPPMPPIFLENIKRKTKEYLNSNNVSIYPKLLEEIEQENAKCSQQIWLNTFLKQNIPKPVSSSSRSLVAISSEYNQIRCLNFKRICTRLETRLLITQPYIRASVAASQEILPEALLEISSFRRPFAKPHYISDLQLAFRCALTDIRHLIANRWYPKVTNNLLHLLEVYPPRHRDRFFALATLIITDQVVSAIRRTIELLLAQTRDRAQIPNISIDMLLEQEGSSVVSPNLKEVHRVFHEIIDGLSSAGQGMPSLEFWMDEFPNIASNSYLPVRLTKNYLVETHLELQNNLDEAYARVCDYVSELTREHAVLIDGSLQKQVEAFLDSPHTLEEALSLAIKCEHKEHGLQKLPGNVFLIVAKIGLREFAKTLLRRAISLRDQVLAVQLIRLREETQSITSQLSELETHANQIPENPEEMVELAEYMDTAEDKVEDLTVKLSSVTKILSELMMHVQVPQEVREAHILTVRGIRDISLILKANSIMMENERSRLEAALSTRCDELTEKLIATQPMLVVLNLMDNINNVDDYKYRLQLLLEEVDILEKEQKQINYEEGIFKLPLTLFPQMDEITGMIKPFFKLIELCRVWIRTQKLWLDGPFSLIEPNKLIQKLEDFNKDGNKWLTLFKDKIRQQIADNFPRRFQGNVDDPDPNMFPAPIKLCSQLLLGVRDLADQKRLIQVLGNRSLKSRHWAELGEIVGRPIIPNAGTSLKKLLDLNLTPHTEEFEVVGISADKELALRIELKEMQKLWQKVQIPFIQFHGHRIIEHPLCDLHSLYIEHEARVRAMRGGAFVRPLEQQLRAWGHTLTCIEESLDLWSRVQANWLSFENLMSCSVISQNLSEEVQLFIQVDRNYRSFISSIEPGENINYLDFLSKRFLENMRSLEKNLEIIENGIYQYLDKKRNEFPRFFHLSNQELLEILSVIQEPINVKKHIQKIFTGIESLKFHQDTIIGSILSPSGEELDLREPIDISNFEGCVEKWLLELENEIKQTLTLELDLSLNDYYGRSLPCWILDWPYQIALLVSKVIWTAQIESSYKSQSLKKYWNQMTKNIEEIVNLSPYTQLPSAQRNKLSRIIAWHLQARDITEELLQNESRENFTWLTQMRYYRINENEIEINSLSNRLKYGFEYINQNLTKGLSWTPTARYYNAVLLAHGLHQHITLQGPPGCGKTSNVRELAKELGWPCHVHTLQEENINFRATLIRLIKAAICGFWICLLHVHLLTAPALSVISHYLMTFSRALYSDEHFCKLDEFEPVVINKVQRGLFALTWTSGYKFQKLPISLLAALRPIAFGPIEPSRIIEISLRANGFCNYSELALKINTLLSMVHDRLHLNWTFRELQTIISRAIQLKLKNTNENEENILLEAIEFLSIPLDDSEIFQSMLKGIFANYNKQNVLNEDTFLIDKIKVFLEKLKLQPDETFMKKIIQGWDMIKSGSLGLIIMGPPGGGKSCILKILSEIFQVPLEIINSKTVILRELIGKYDNNNRWLDGLITSKIRNFNSVNSRLNEKWIVFDGPLASSQMEYLSPLMDERHNLTIFSGEVFLKPREMKIIFETCELEDTSPATISRCSILYIDPRELGWKPLLVSWLKKNNWDHDELFFKLFNNIFSKCLDWTFKIKENRCLFSIFNSVSGLMDIILKDALDSGEDSKNIQYWIQAAFIFSLVWGIGNTLQYTYMEKFDLFLKSIWTENLGNSDLNLPNESLLQDYFYIFKGKGSWKLWSDLLKSAKIEEKSNFWKTIIPTVEFIRYSHIIGLYIRKRIPLILYGPLGSGKWTYLKEVLGKQKLNTAQINLRVTSSANETQNAILKHLCTKDKITYRPENNDRLIYLINDLSQPEDDSPWEVIRQLFDQGFWHMSNERGSFHKVYPNNFQVIAKLNKGLQKITRRLFRHFVQLNVYHFQDETISKIFGSLLGLAWKKNGFSNDICSMSQLFFTSTLTIWRKCQKEFISGPMSPHYLFSVHDLARVIHGCTSIRKEPSGDDRKSLIRLWTHEMIREFQDRLISEDHRLTFLDQITQELEVIYPGASQYLSKDDTVNISLDSLEDLIFLKIKESDNKDSNWTDMLGGVEQVERFLISQNDLQTDLILFRWLVANCAKVARIFAQMHGHCLLLGNAGSGRETIVRLASHIAEGQLHEITCPSNQYEVQEWRKDLKRLMHALAKADGGEIFFLIPGDRFENFSFWDDITSLINCGEIYDLFQDMDERDEILDIIRIQAQGGNRNSDISPGEVFSFLHRRCRDHLHNAICLNPATSTNRHLLFRWPVLNERCTQIWLTSWPSEAFIGIADTLLPQMECEFTSSIFSACQQMHLATNRHYKEYLRASGNFSHITNTTYIHLIKGMVERVKERREILNKERERYEQGLQRLSDAEKEVDSMKANLQNMQPLLNQAADRMKDMMAVIAKETDEVAKASELIRVDEQVCNARAAEAQLLKDECETDLAQAIPILEDAIEALNTLKPTDITLVKSMKNPPGAIKMVMAAVCVMRDVPPDKLTDPATGRRSVDYWGPSKRILGDMYFLQSLKEFDKDNISEDIMTKIRTEYLPHRDFKPNVVAKASSAAEGLCKWVIAMDMYDAVAKEVAPKKAKLAIAEEAYTSTLRELTTKRAQLTELETKLRQLNEHLTEAQTQRKRLVGDEAECSDRLRTAENLIKHLKTEGVDWKNQCTVLKDQLENLPGDSLLTCSAIIYLGPLSSSFRKELLNDWQQILKDKDLLSENWNLFKELLGNEFDKIIGCWHLNGLPREESCLEHACLVYASRTRWPLIIDPEGSAKSWIKQIEANNDLAICELSDENYITILKDCISSGRPILIEFYENFTQVALEALFHKQECLNNENQYLIQIGDQIIEYNKHFRLFLINKSKTPQCTSEIFKTFNVINFEISIEALTDQFLGVILSKESPELENKYNKNLNYYMKNQKVFEDIEYLILNTLSETKGEILEDKQAIGILDSSKKLSSEKIRKRDTLKGLLCEIQNERNDYRNLAKHASILYRSSTLLSSLSNNYIYSLDSFIKVLKIAISRSKRSPMKERRLDFLTESLTYTFYVQIERSLLQKHKLAFTFLLAALIQIKHGKLQQDEFEFLISYTHKSSSFKKENSPYKWLDIDIWKQINFLKKFSAFRNFTDDFEKRIEEWRIWFNDKSKTELIQPWQDKLNEFSRMIIIKIFKPEYWLDVAQTWLNSCFGKEFFENLNKHASDLNNLYSDSNCFTPLIILSDGNASVLKFLEQLAKRNQRKLQGLTIVNDVHFEKRVELIVKRCKEVGDWVYIRESHQGRRGWLLHLQRILKSFNLGNTHLEFRLWIIADHLPNLPPELLENALKFSWETPKGLKSNIYSNFTCSSLFKNDEMKANIHQTRTWMKLFYSLIVWHATVRARNDFGPRNIPYYFNENNLDLAHLELKKLLIDYCSIKNDVLLEALSSHITEFIYGGQIADLWHRRLLQCTLKQFINEQIICDVSYTPLDVCQLGLPLRQEKNAYINHISNLPDRMNAKFCSLNDYNDIWVEKNKANNLLTCLKYFFKNENFNEDYENNTKELITDIIEKIPESLNCNITIITNPIQSVLIQEVERYNTLLKVIHNDLNKYLNHEPSFDFKMSLQRNEIPKEWIKVSYYSKKSLASFIHDLQLRTTFIQRWQSEATGLLDTFWLPGFFNPRCFLTAVRQLLAEKAGKTVDKLGPIWNIVDDSNFVQVNGLWLQGASFENRMLVESKSFIEKINSLCLAPAFPTSGIYTCPIYSCSDRSFDSYIASIGFNSHSKFKNEHWILREVALISE